MKKAFHNFLVFILIISGIIFLIGKNHFILGSLLGLSQIPIIIIGAWILWRRRKKSFGKNHKILLVIVGLLILNWSYEHVRRINLKSASGTENEVSILTYNLYFKNKYQRQIINEIKKTDADIVVVQELTSAWDRGLKKEIYQKYKHRKTYVNDGTLGLGIFSKYPIESCEYIGTNPKFPINQIGKILVNDKALVVVNSHLASPAKAVENPDNFLFHYKANYQLRTKQWKQLEKYLTNNYKGIPQVIAGDLNTMKIEPLYHEIRHEWKDLFAKKGWGLSHTFPNVAKIPVPVLTLDYVLYRGNIKPIESEVLKGSSSDHFAVFGKIEM